jgi:hypothetical protein
MTIEVVDSSSADTAVKEIKYLARLKRKTIMTVLLAVTALLLLFGILFKFFIWGSPVKSGDIAVDAYTVKDDISGERLFLLDFELQNGKTLHVDSKMLYSPENEAIGVILTPRVVANNPLDNTGPEFQYGYHLDSNSNFRITVRYPDDKKVYDMREFSHS